MHARSALFDLYGDHLRTRDERAPVAALVRLMASLGIAAPAVRTAISRMVRQGWLEPTRVRAGRGYALTPRARQRLDDAAARIYRTRDASWDGAWDLLVLDPVGHRAARERVRTGLSFLGYGQLSDSTWISPFASPEADELLSGEKVGFARFRAADATPERRSEQAWDLSDLASSYVAWQRFAERLLGDPDTEIAGLSEAGDDERAFAVRSVLVHEWRKFLFTDPGLPRELLPDDWAGHQAARFFGDEAARLLPAAARFVDTCLETSTNGDRP
ncbi:MAG: PaaX family transcriptional regulator [Nocardioidaceae bacterium]|nr:PaaX family transcriptional regulator [Nocardioidaceae bacterium]NUS50717.1 PaaX family transcriptional regulator [Nocardioidaceae bacterium]